MSTLVGERFEIEREAGAGAFARVYRARDITTDATVAVKILNTASDHTLRRFAREVSALGELDHPNIVRYVAHGTTASGQAFLAMEWLEGESLQDRIDRGALSVVESVALGRGLASALGAAHARGLVHRDVKPANIFLVERDAARPKLLDFGLARDTLATFGLTATGDLLGTPLYMAPEQASCELDVDARVDVYALGAVLYACLSGRPPLLAPNLVALLAKIVVDEPPPLGVLVPGLSPGLVELISRMLAKSRTARPAHGQEAEAALAAATASGSPKPGARATIVPLREQRVVSILLASDVNSSAAMDATLGAEGGAMRLADGSTIVIVSGPESPVDLASRAAPRRRRMGSSVSAARSA